MLEMMIWTMFAIANMRHITGLEISKRSKCAKKQLQFPKVWKHCKSYIHCVRHVGNDDLNYVCHIVNMMRITEVVISNKPKRAEKIANSKSL